MRAQWLIATLALSLGACVPGGGGGGACEDDGGCGPGGSPFGGAGGGAGGAGGAGAEGGEGGAGPGGAGGAGAEGGAGGAGGEGGAGGAGPGGAGGAGPGGAGGGGPDCARDGFVGGPAQWRLPFPLEEDRRGPGSDSHAVLDLTGDGVMDLVVFDARILPAGDPLVSRAYWRVYPGGAGGFAQEPLSWRLPFPVADGDRGRLSSREFTLADLDGDGRTDLVVHRRDILPEGDPLVGRAYWRVYLNTGAGFAEEATRWALPFPLDDAQDNSQLASASHGVLDLSGDGRPDLVVFKADILAEGDPLVGRAYWRVYENNGSGFAMEASRWSLPYPFEERSAAASDAHTLLDLDADGRLDLVVYDQAITPGGDPLVSRAYWRLHRNTGSGFAMDATQWQLPFPVRDGERGTVGGRAYALVDFEADGALDLLVFDDEILPASDPLIGRAYWQLYPNTGRGFASEGFDWRLPVPLEGRAAGLGTRDHGILSAGDGCPALFFFTDEELAEGDPLIGRAYWRLHP